MLPVEKAELEEAFASDEAERVCNAMVATAFYEQDWRWAQDKCVSFFLGDNYQYIGLAATCLGHIARVLKTLEKDKIIDILTSRIGDEQFAGIIEDAIDDIKMFVK